MMQEFYVPSKVDLNDDFFVYTGTIYGEIRGGTLQAKQNVAQAILNRHSAEVVHNSAVGIKDICLAHEQFSCWNTTDPNRAEILCAYRAEPKIWAMCAQVAWDAMNGENPNRINGACNYYATWMHIAPPWAKPPAVVTLNDGFHVFIRL